MTFILRILLTAVVVVFLANFLPGVTCSGLFYCNCCGPCAGAAQSHREANPGPVHPAGNHCYFWIIPHCDQCHYYSSGRCLCRWL